MVRYRIRTSGKTELNHFFIFFGETLVNIVFVAGGKRDCQNRKKKVYKNILLLFTS